MLEVEESKWQKKHDHTLIKIKRLTATGIAFETQAEVESKVSWVILCIFWVNFDQCYDWEASLWHANTILGTKTLA